MPHPSTTHAVMELRYQDLLVFAAQQRLAGAACSRRLAPPVRPWWRLIAHEGAERVGLARLRIRPPRLAPSP